MNSSYDGQLPVREHPRKWSKAEFCCRKPPASDAPFCFRFWYVCDVPVCRNIFAFLLMMGSFFCWWPLIVPPNLDLPWWIPDLCVACSAGLATILHKMRWWHFPLASGLGTFSGLCAGYAIWWPRDPIAGPLVPYVIAATTIETVFISLAMTLAFWKLTVSNTRIVRVAFFAFVAFGPICAAVTPPLLQYRVRRNDRIAVGRFIALKKAVEQTAAEAGTLRQVCNASAVKRHYTGAPSGDEDWRRITGNYVRQDGYFFMLHCREKDGYVIDAHPAKEQGYGTRHLCTDESTRIGCDMEWNRTRHTCLPCLKQTSLQ